MTRRIRPRTAPPGARRRGAARALAQTAALLAVAATLGSCAYYNTFYLARKYYFRATDGAPYTLDPAPGASSQNFLKSIEYSKKVLGVYSNSKWVDDAYLLWARALLGRDDPLETINMLESFDSRFPKSPLRQEAVFYLGVAYRHARKYTSAVHEFDQFLAAVPRHRLAAYAYLERARALVSLKRFGEAATSAGTVLERFPKSPLVTTARTARAEALFQNGDYAKAREDYAFMEQNASNDADRLEFLLHQADCLEAARDFAGELTLLEDALSHEQPPPVTFGAGDRPQVTQTAGYDRYGRIELRIGTAHLLAGDETQALATYRKTLKEYPYTPIGAEAQYRIGYTFETLGDDFDRARSEYAAVRDQFPASAFTAQADGRLQNLQRIAQYRGAGADSMQKQVESGFLLAEQYLFQLDKPERALTEYARIAREYEGTPYGGKALNAEAWVLARKLDRHERADSLLWDVVHHYPGTQAQLDARDYLERAGTMVPDSLIVPPKPPPVDTAAIIAAEAPLVGPPAPGSPADSLSRLGPRPPAPPGLVGPGPPPTLRPDELVGHPLEMSPQALADSARVRAGIPVDSLRALEERDTLGVPAPRDTARLAPPPADTTARPPQPPDTTGAAADTSLVPVPADSSAGSAPADTAGVSGR